MCAHTVLLIIYLGREGGRKRLSFGVNLRWVGSSNYCVPVFLSLGCVYCCHLVNAGPQAPILH